MKLQTAVYAVTGITIASWLNFVRPTPAPSSARSQAIAAQDSPQRMRVKQRGNGLNILLPHQDLLRHFGVTMRRDAMVLQ